MRVGKNPAEPGQMDRLGRFNITTQLQQLNEVGTGRREHSTFP